MVIVIVRMGVSHPVVRVLMRMRCTRSERVGVRMIVVPVVVGMLVRMGDGIVRVRVSMLGSHRCLLGDCGVYRRGRTAVSAAEFRNRTARLRLTDV